MTRDGPQSTSATLHGVDLRYGLGTTTATLRDSGNEAAWWHDMGIEPLEIARQLWDESQKHQRFFANHDLDDHKSKIDKPSVDQIG